ncbi:MAG: hypothetical protein WAN46_06045 [Gammaproteobacteria bacterium]
MTDAPASGVFKHHSRRRAPLVAALAVCGGLGANSVTATEGQVNPEFTDRFSLRVGGFFPSIDSKIRLDSTTGRLGTVLDFEDDLALEETSPTFWAGARWRITRRQRLEFEYVQLDRSGTRAASADFAIGDTIANAGALLETDFDVKLGRFTYGFSLINDGRKELALLIGAHFAGADAGIQISGNLTVAGLGSLTRSTPRREEGDIVFPLPHIGGSFGWAFTPKLSATATAIGFALDLGDYQGSLVEVSADLQYQLVKHLALGAGLKYFNLDLEDKSNADLRGEFEFNYLGPTVFAAVNF